MYKRQGKVKVKWAYTDDALELISAMKAHGIPHEQSAPYVRETNGKIEVHNRIQLHGARTNMVAAGAPLSFRPDAARHLAFSRNIYDVKGKGSPYLRKFHEEFPGLRIPFFARVRFRQYIPIERGTDSHRAAAPMVYGIFVGYGQVPGGKWNKQYRCAALKEFIGMELRVGHHVHI